MQKAKAREAENTFYHSRLSESISKIRHFVEDNQNKQLEGKRALQPITNLGELCSPAAKKARRSVRIRKPIVSPSKDSSTTSKPVPFTGIPPGGANKWTKELLVKALVNLEGTRRSKAFIDAVLRRGRSPYKTAAGIYKLYYAWKKNGVVRNSGPGRPAILNIIEVEDAAKAALRSCTASSSVFQLRDMKTVYEDKLKLCLPELLEATMKKQHIKKSFVEAGMVDEETGMVPVFDRLIGTCKRWISSSVDIGIPKIMKQHCRDQFQHLMKIQMNEGQISYADMDEVGIPADIGSNGLEVLKWRPFGPDAEHLQSAKTINAAAQKRHREDKRRKKIIEDAHRGEIEKNAIDAILARNESVERELKEKKESRSLADATVADFLELKPASKLEDFIHARKFEGQTFQRAKLAGSDGKLNKTRYKGQSASSIEESCSIEEPCLVWLAWKLRTNDVVLKKRISAPVSISLQEPDFIVSYAGPERMKTPSDFLRDQSWVDGWKAMVKGVGSVTMVTN
mmetsp:Transcript_44512/g.93388  ORF Transcript_44512/g.93388 Transcript_44512/m.93388 type:complete len:511 (-) Transcript_44512:806-2338(-)